MKTRLSTQLSTLLAIFVLFFASSCQEGSEEAADLQSEDFAIYLVKESNTASVLAELSLEEKPLLTSADIDFYDFTGHVIHLKREVPTPITKGAFVVVAKGERCYQGIFQPGYVSALYPGVLINVAPRFYADDILAIYFVALTSGTPDPRNDSRIRTVLMKEGKFKEGLSGELTAVQEVAGTSPSVQYTYTLHNLGAETLYVLDPNRMGSKLFHYFTNGAVLAGKNGSYGGEYQATAPVPENNIQESWFTPHRKREEYQSNGYFRRLSSDTSWPVRKLPGVFIAFHGCKESAIAEKRENMAGQYIYARSCGNHPLISITVGQPVLPIYCHSDFQCILSGANLAGE